MSKENQFPYPTHFEIIRYLVGLFDLKMSNKKLDDLARKANFHPQELDDVIQEYITDVMTRKIDLDTSRIISDWLIRAFKDYGHLVASYMVDGISREDLLPLLISSFVKDKVVELMDELHQYFGGPEAIFIFSNDTNSIGTAIDWFEQNEINWSHYIASIDKEQRDLISCWKRGDQIPSSQSIYLLQINYKGPWPEYINWQRVRTWLFIARAIDKMRKTLKLAGFLEQIRLNLCGADNTVSFEGEVAKLQNEVIKGIDNNVLNSIASLQHDLRRTAIKDNPNFFTEHFMVVRNSLSSQLRNTTGYWIDWHEARWNVFNGDLNKANNLYRLAFDGALFRSGENLKAIIEEAIVIASSLDKPDKAFLKHLKWAQINFGYDIASVNDENTSNTFSGTVEEWEIDLWKSSFATIFPENGLFEGVSYIKKGERLGPLMISPETTITPDFRYPSRKIKVGETWQKTMPQLQWFIVEEDFETVSKLIEKDADVNAVSDANDSALIGSLKIMNVLDVPFQSLDERFFKLISEQLHTPEIVNGRTDKKRLLPLILAVETGRLDIVNKVLGMGADPNTRGETDEQTTLNICIKLIGRIKNSAEFWKNQNSIPITVEVLDAVRRHNAGLSGFTLEQQQAHIDWLESDPRYKAIEKEIQESINDRVQQLLDIKTMREMARALISAGADVNAMHVSPVNGYTPLMLAAELNEVELFKKMLISGGRPEQYYRDPKTNRSVDCRTIAEASGAKDIQNILADIQPHYSSNLSIN